MCAIADSICVCCSSFSLALCISVVCSTLLRIWTCFCVFFIFNPRNTRTTTGLFLICKAARFCCSQLLCKRSERSATQKWRFLLSIQCSHLFWVRVNFSYMKCSSSSLYLTHRQIHLNANDKEQMILKYFCAFCDSVVRC